MATNSKDYWKAREEENLRRCIREEAKYIRELNSTYEYMQRQIQKEIDSFYARYAAREGISIAEAKRRANKLDIDAYAEKAKRYIKEKNFSELANAEMRLYNLTMKVNRLELLKAQIGLELAAGFNEIEKKQEQILKQRAQDELARQAGILGATIANNAKMANAIVNSSFKNAKFSDRIWMHQEMLKAEIDKLLKIGLIQGRNPRELARQLRKSFDASKYNSERLMHTELARVQTETQKQSYIDNGYDRYQFHALGLKACEICRDIDGKDFPVEKMMPGENAPPMHPNCRCSTSAYMDRLEYDKWLDEYKNHGLSFADWKKGRLSRLEENALRKYIGPDSYKLNDKLRNGLPLTGDDKQFINDLDSALSKMPNYEGIVYRSLDSSMIKDIEFFNKQHSVGSIVSYSAYTSTATNIYDKTMDMQLIINSKTGKDMRKYNPGEKEILFERNRVFYVEKRRGNKIWLTEI